MRLKTNNAQRYVRVFFIFVFQPEKKALKPLSIHIKIHLCHIVTSPLIDKGINLASLLHIWKLQSFMAGCPPPPVFRPLTTRPDLDSIVPHPSTARAPLGPAQPSPGGYTQGMAVDGEEKWEF